MQTKREYMKEADWYEKKVQSQSERIEELEDENRQLSEEARVYRKGYEQAEAEVERLKGDVFALKQGREKRPYLVEYTINSVRTIRTKRVHAYSRCDAEEAVKAMGFINIRIATEE